MDNSFCFLHYVSLFCTFETDLLAFPLKFLALRWLSTVLGPSLHIKRKDCYWKQDYIFEWKTLSLSYITVLKISERYYLLFQLKLIWNYCRISNVELESMPTLFVLKITVFGLSCEARHYFQFLFIIVTYWVSCTHTTPCISCADPGHPEFSGCWFFRTVNFSEIQR